MYYNKKFFYILLINILFIFLSISLIFITPPIYKHINDYTIISPNQSMILMIGDGMGFNHLAITKTYYDIPKLNMETLPIQGKARTQSLSYPIPTDSAAAGTALSCGVKVNNSNVAYYNSNNLTSITEYYKKFDKGVGIVCSDYLYGATPAAFSSHSRKRTNKETIITSQLNSDIDLFICRSNSDYQQYFDLTEHSYTYLVSPTTIDLTTKKSIITYDNIYRSSYPNPESLASLTLMALTYLDKLYPQGFFLMIEASHIDKMSHNNDLLMMMHCLYQFDLAVKTVIDYCQTHPQSSLIVTADHETGMLNYHNETKNQIDLNNNYFLSQGHTNRDVPYFTNVPIKSIPSYIDNTEIFQIMYTLLDQ